VSSEHDGGVRRRQGFWKGLLLRPRTRSVVWGIFVFHCPTMSTSSPVLKASLTEETKAKIPGPQPHTATQSEASHSPYRLAPSWPQIPGCHPSKSFICLRKTSWAVISIYLCNLVPGPQAIDSSVDDSPLSLHYAFLRAHRTAFQFPGEQEETQSSAARGDGEAGTCIISTRCLHGTPHRSILQIPCDIEPDPSNTC
jgi:hypothetical protein